LREFLRRSPLHFTTPRKEDEQQIPEGLMQKCGGCGELIYAKQWEENAKVCPRCGHHERISAGERIDLLLDPDSWQEYDADLAPGDPLHFVSPRSNYANKIELFQAATGRLDAAVWGLGKVEDLPLVVCAHEYEKNLAGSMGSVVGEKIARAAERAAALSIPLLTINASGGARMQEGILSLMQMAKVSVALARLAEARQPHFSVMADPCTGGVTASHASSADVIIAEPGALIGFAGPRVIEQTIHQKLPPNFQRAEFLLEHGMVDMVTPRAELRAVIGRLLRLYA
jgi:acetyl-CoA carboxylase carboxyl transferase subunit beta